MSERMFGTRIIESVHMVDTVEDWSRVRSPGRAARRRKKHRQNIVTISTPKREALRMPDGSLVMHPEMMRALRAAIKEKEDTALRHVLGWPSPPKEKNSGANGRFCGIVNLNAMT